MSSQQEPLFPQAAPEGVDPVTWPGLPIRKLRIEWKNLCKAIELDALHMLYYLDTQTGETILVTEDSFAFLEETGTFAAAAGLTRQEIVKAREIAADRDERYLEIESRGSRESRRDMEDFYETITDPTLHSKIRQALAEENSFPQFREALANHPAEQARWYGFRNRRLQGFAQNWLASQGIVPTNPLAAQEAPTEAAPVPAAPVQTAATEHSAKSAFDDIVLCLLDCAAQDGIENLSDLQQRLAESFVELENQHLVEGLRTGSIDLTEKGRAKLSS